MRKLLSLMVLVVLLFVQTDSYAQQLTVGTKPNQISLNLRDVPISEVMEMLAQRERLNIILTKGVSGDISINLYDVNIHTAIASIVTSAGYILDKRGGTYYILTKEEAERSLDNELTSVRTYKIQYTDPKLVESILQSSLSQYGKITVLDTRKILVVKDTLKSLRNIEKLLKQVDRAPKQILIEAKILEITLEENESYGIDWKKLFTVDGSSGSTGTQGFSPGGSGFFLELVTPNVEVLLESLKTTGRAKTLSTPKLLTLEDKQASVVIGDRIGYRVTTTINAVTTESIEFLESGVILKVKPSVDNNGNIVLEVQPQVSTGKIASGLPSQTTTEVNTQLLVADGQTVFIGGLMKMSSSETRRGVPILSDIPLLGRLFAYEQDINVNTETVVMITPRIIHENNNSLALQMQRQLQAMENELGGLKSALDTSPGTGGVSQEKTFTTRFNSHQSSYWDVADDPIW